MRRKSLSRSSDCCLRESMDERTRSSMGDINVVKDDDSRKGAASRFAASRRTLRYTARNREATGNTPASQKQRSYGSITQDPRRVHRVRLVDQRRDELPVLV